MYYLDEIKAYTPCCEQEAADKDAMLAFAEGNPGCLLRSCLAGHFTASAWIVNPARDRVLFCWHNLYRSWSWVGGHADGERDLVAAARRELAEETGLHAEKLVHLATVLGSPGFTDEHTEVFLAQGLSQGAARPDEGEVLRVVWLPVDEVVQAISAGLIQDGKTVTGVLAAKALLESEQAGNLR